MGAFKSTPGGGNGRLEGVQTVSQVMAAVAERAALAERNEAARLEAAAGYVTATSTVSTPAGTALFGWEADESVGQGDAAPTTAAELVDGDHPPVDDPHAAVELE